MGVQVARKKNAQRTYSGAPLVNRSGLGQVNLPPPLHGPPDVHLPPLRLTLPRPGSWSVSLGTSTLVHGAALAVLWLGAAPLFRIPGGPSEPVELPLVFARADLQPESLPLEPESLAPLPPLEPVDVSEAEVLPLPVAETREILPEEPGFLPVDLARSPLERLTAVTFATRRHPDPPVESAPPTVAWPTPPEPELDEPPGADVVDHPPLPLAGECAPPAYPRRARLRRIEGTVVCLITVGVDGSVVRVIVERSSGHELLDRTAVECMRDWRFEPGIRDGLPAQMDVRESTVFQLDSPH